MFGAARRELLAELGAPLGAALDNVLLLREALHARRWMRAAATLTQELLADELAPAPADRRAGAWSSPTPTRRGRRSSRTTCSSSGTSAARRAGRRCAPGELPLTGRPSPRRTILERRRRLVFARPRPEVSVTLRGVERHRGRPRAGASRCRGADGLLGRAVRWAAEDDPRGSPRPRSRSPALRRPGRDRARARSARQVPGAAAAGRGPRPHRPRPPRPRRAAPVRHRVSLQRVVNQLEGAARERVVRRDVAIDETIRQIRNTILTLRPRATTVTLTDMITDIATRPSPLLGLRADPRPRPGSRDGQRPARRGPGGLRARGAVERGAPRQRQPGRHPGRRAPRSAGAQRRRRRRRHRQHRRSGLDNLAKRARSTAAPRGRHRARPGADR